MSDHYNKHSITALEIINDWDLNFNLGNVIKYVARCRYKGSKHEDIRKAISYLRNEILLDIAKASSEARNEQIDPNKAQYEPILRYDDDKLRDLRGGQ